DGLIKEGIIPQPSLEDQVRQMTNEQKIAEVLKAFECEQVSITLSISLTTTTANSSTRLKPVLVSQW
ncbi:hypothetical protein QBC36DRAFT_194944, partial [Triangularia setosa]